MYLLWQWRRIAPAVAAAAAAATVRQQHRRSNNNAYKRAKRRKQVSHSGFNVRLYRSFYTEKKSFISSNIKSCK